MIETSPRRDDNPMPWPHFFTRLFAPVADSEGEIRRHLFWWILVRVVLFTLVVGATCFFQGKGFPVIAPPFPFSILFLIAIYSFSLCSATILQKTKWSARRFGVIQLLSDTLFIALLIYATGCSQSYFTPLFLLPIIAAGLILHRMGGLALAAATTLLYGALVIGERLGWTPDYFAFTAYKQSLSFFEASNTFAIYGLMFFLAALLSGQLARRLRLTEQELNKRSLEYDQLAILYKQIFDDISTGIITTDSSDCITSCNQAAERITGFSRMLLLQQPFVSRFPSLSLQQERQGRNVCDFVKRGGTTIRLGYSFSNLNMPIEADPDKGARAKWKVITLQDISQIERMEHQIHQAEKLAAIGEMSASIAHGFRNPLAAISGSAQILSMEQGNLADFNPATFNTLVAIILRESNRMAKTITDFLQFARPAAIVPEWFVVDRLVDEVVTVLCRGIYAVPATSISKEIAQHLSCWGDRQQLQTVLIHLLENACAAVGAKQSAIVVAGCEDTNGGRSHLLLEIRDEGPGIPLELKEKVFEPFFSNRSNGTGLGLSIIRQIIENHHGTVTVENRRPVGCILRIRLPLPQTSLIP